MASSVWPAGFEGPIADVVSMAAHIELTLEQLVVAGLPRNPGVANFIVRNFATEKLVGVAEQVVGEALPEQAALAAQVFKAVRLGREQRNIILHRVWQPMPDEPGLKMRSRPGRDEAQSRNLEDIQKLANDLAEASIGLTLFLADLGQWAGGARSGPRGAEAR